MNWLYGECVVQLFDRKKKTHDDGHTMTTPRWKQLKDAGVDTPGRLLSELGIHFPPIDVVRVCELLGVELRGAPGSTWSGAVNSNETRAVIWVDTDEAATRQRFSIAHELGHLFLHQTGVMFRDTEGQSNDPRERQANQFAAELLMPEHLVLARSAFFGRSTRALASAFAVSEMAMQYRLKNLGLTPRP